MHICITDSVLRLQVTSSYVGLSETKLMMLLLCLCFRSPLTTSELSDQLGSQSNWSMILNTGHVMLAILKLVSLEISVSQAKQDRIPQ